MKLLKHQILQDEENIKNNGSVVEEYGTVSKCDIVCA